jgi:hypothetical protein
MEYNDSDAMPGPPLSFKKTASRDGALSRWEQEDHASLSYIARPVSKKSQALMAHAYNSSYSGGRDQEGYCSKPAWENSS